MTDTKRAVIYARCASVHMNFESPSDVDIQINECHELIDHENWTLVGKYCDNGFGGLATNRPGYSQLSQDAELGKFDVVVATSLDRFSRDVEELLHFCYHMHEQRVMVVTALEGKVREGRPTSHRVKFGSVSFR